MPETIGGLPLHPLIVHGTVVLLPLAAIAVVLYAFVPRFRAWSGWLTPALAVTAFLLVPLSTSTGESLEHSVERSAQLHEHSELGESLIPLSLILALTAGALYWLLRPRAEGTARTGGRALVIGATVLAVLASVGTVTQVVRTGHSGAKAAWGDVVTGQENGEAAPVTGK